MSDFDKVFSGSIPKLYETYLVPLIFEAYADLTKRPTSLLPLSPKGSGRMPQMASSRRTLSLSKNEGSRRMKTRLVLCCTLMLAACSAAPTRPQPSCFHKSEAVETEIGYCQAVRADNRLYISGTVGQGEMPVAVQSVYERLRQTLEANGLTFGNVVKENVYTTDLDAFKGSKDIRKSFYGSTLPAATWVQVQRLFLPSFVLEVELVAEYPK